MRNLLLFIAALLVALLAAEGVLRLLGQSYYWAVAKRPDPQLGWRPAAGVSAWQRLEGEALIETNRLGFRDRDHPLAKDPGRLRIAVLGDSFTAAVQVPLAQTWWQRLAERLNGEGCAGGAGAPAPAGAEVLSFGVSGYSTAQSLLAFRHEASRFAPDAVLLVLFLGNDLPENSPALDDEPLRPYLRLHGGGLVRDDGFRDSAAYRFRVSPAGRVLGALVRRSYLAQQLIQVRHLAAARGAGAPAAAAGAAEPGVDNGIYRPPADADWREAWAVTEAILAAFAAEVRDAAAEPLLLIAGTAAQVHPNAAATAAFARRIGVADLGYPVRRLLRAAERLDLPVVNLPARMAAEAERTGTVLHGFDNALPGFGHWNAAGHAVAARAAAETLCRPPMLRRLHADGEG